MLKQLEKLLKSEKKDKRIFDIIIYGSFMKGAAKARDIDLMVIFIEGTLRERLDKIQEMRHKLRQLSNKFDIKQMTLKDFFSSEFLARTGILTEGFSLLRNKKFCELLGFKSYSLVWYELKNLTHTQKVKINYILAGRRDSIGLIKELKGERIASGAIKIPMENSLAFEEVLKNNEVVYKKKNILEAI